MLSVSIHKDITEYQEKIVGKLSLRSLVCVVGGLVTAIVAACVSYFLLKIEVSNAALPVMACSLPFWLAGFWRPKHMTFEQFIPLWLTHHTTANQLLYTPSFLINAETSKPKHRKRRKEVECHEPTQA